ncbi:MAG: hypothetical protein JJ975_07475 [Bacteroidia bacterium]|nr:hypothetical protein [Bacteroidia bacterium]
MENEFDKIVRELIGKKEYTYNKALWAKAKIGLKAAYAKIIVVKSVVAVVATGAAGVAGVAIYQNQVADGSEQATPPAPIEVVQEEVVDTAEHLMASEINNEVEAMEYAEAVEAYEQATSSPETPVSETPQMVTEPEVPTMVAASTTPTSTTYPTEPEPNPALPVPIASNPVQAGPSPTTPRRSFPPINNIEMSAKQTLPVRESRSHTLTTVSSETQTAMTKDRNWSVELSLAEGSAVLTDDLPTNYSSVIDGYESRGLSFKRKVKDNLLLGSGVQTQTWSETREFSWLSPERIIEIDPFRIDSVRGGMGFIFNPFSGQWEWVDTADIRNWPTFGDPVYDTTWATRTERISNRVKSVEIPLTIGYQFELNRLSFIPSLSAGVGYLYSVSYSQLQGPLNERQNFSKTDFNAFYINLRAEASLQYRVAYRNFVSAGVGYSRSTSTLGSPDQMNLKLGSTYYKLGIGFEF